MPIHHMGFYGAGQPASANEAAVTTTAGSAVTPTVGSAVTPTVGAAVDTTAATNSSPYGYDQAQADALVARVNQLRTDLLAMNTVQTALRTDVLAAVTLETALRTDVLALATLVNQLRSDLISLGLIKGAA